MCSIKWWHYQWPWRTPNPVFKVTAFSKSNISETVHGHLIRSWGQCYRETLIRNNTKSIEWYHFQWPWLALDRDFKVAIFFNVEYLRNGMRQSHSYYRISIGSHRLSIEWWHFQWPSRTPNPVFKVTACLKWNISKNVRLTDKVTIAH